MPNNVPPITNLVQLERKAALFYAKSRVNFGLFLQAPFDGPAPQRPYVGTKIYLSKSSCLAAIHDDRLLDEALSSFRLAAIHAEDETCFLPSTGMPPRNHHLRRPKEAILSALDRVEQSIIRCHERGERPRLVLCHASTAEEVEWLAGMKADGFDVWGETCPHYCLLTEEDYCRRGAEYQVNPPLRSEADRAAVLRGLADGTLDFFGSDHAPHSQSEKAQEMGSPSGIPGIEWMLRVLLMLVDQGHLTWKRAMEVGSRNASRCYGIAERGQISEGAWADLILVRQEKEQSGTSGPEKSPDKKFKETPIMTRAGYAPFADHPLHWKVETVLVGGRIALREGAYRYGVSPMEVCT
jgi:dihydroorotase